MPYPIIVISMGDPAGIGPEITLKALKKVRKIHLVVIGSKKVFDKAAHRLQSSCNLKRIDSFEEYQQGHALLDTVKPFEFKFGKPDKNSSAMALESIDQAISFIKQGLARGLVTAPISKEGLRFWRRGFIGHTEYLARRFNTRKYGMMGISGDKRVFFLTTHMPLRSVFKFVNKPNIIRSLKILHHGLKTIFRIKNPKIGVANLNPHGFEFSTGEDEKIVAGIRASKQLGIRAFGPLPGDAIFNQQFDGYLAMYHDQGMVYLKSRPDGVNFTLGLPFIRTSPLHGTAFDIAGRNQADAGFMIAAIKLAANLCNHDRIS